MNEQDIIALESLKDSGSVIISPLNTHVDVSDSARFKRVDADLNLMGLSSQLPALAAAASTTGLYTVKFPNGITGELVRLSNNGFSSMIRGDKGGFKAHASFHKFEMPAMVGLMTAMALASGQYFLANISQEMNLISQGIDKILDFLYGNKKAELLSEISFIQRATRDYASIVSHEGQKVATLVSIQEAEKVAMKDIEFYIGDLEKTSNLKIEENRHIRNATETILQICESLRTSLQLYISSCILEVYYSENVNDDYINNLRSDLDMYIDKCHTRMLKFVSLLKGRIDNAKPTTVIGIKKSSLKKQPYSDQLSKLSDSLSNGMTQTLQQSVKEALNAPKKEIEFIATTSGELYLKTS